MTSMQVMESMSIKTSLLLAVSDIISKSCTFYWYGRFLTLLSTKTLPGLFRFYFIAKIDSLLIYGKVESYNLSASLYREMGSEFNCFS